MTARDVAFASQGAVLAGTLWLPDAPSPVGVIMVGGSGPSDRNNDVFFPPIRERLVAHGIAVLSYDKRGVGDSTGSWIAASIDDFAADAAAAYVTLRAQPEVSVAGFFGHSEGGWVVLRAAPACADLAFLVTNSTPGMTPVEQDRYALGSVMRAAGEAEAAIVSCEDFYDTLTDMARSGATFAEASDVLQSHPSAKLFASYAGEIGEDEWRSVRPKLDHDPLPDISAVSCPHLALFGEHDPLVPVPPSVTAFRAARRDVEIEVFPGADHRLRTADADYAPGYLEKVTAWIMSTAVPG
jgi:pimeloyl-ACP methyl ester carboxylesterase